MKIQTQTLGYPRIGKKRELKKALEAYWKGESNAETLLKVAREVETNNWKAQLNAGIDRIGVGNETFNDGFVSISFSSDRAFYVEKLEQFLSDKFPSDAPHE